MAEGQSEYLAHKELSILRGSSYDYPSGGFRLHLSKDVPSSTGTYTPVTGTGYTYFSINSSYFGTAANREIANISEIQFANPGSSWDTPIGIAITDTSANLWYFGTNEVTKVVNQNEPPYYDIGDLKITKTVNKQCSSTYWANKRLDVLRGSSIAPPPYVELVLLSTVPNTTDTINEITIPGYTYPQIPCDTDNWNAPANRAITNKLAIEFPKPDENLPAIAGFALKDDSGNVLWKAPLTYRLVQRKDKLFISPGDLVIKA